MPVNLNPNVNFAAFGKLGELLEKLKPVKTTFTGSDGRDVITVKPDTDPFNKGGVIVTVNGESYSVPKDKVKDIVINAGGGRDTVTVDPRVKEGITINGGDGNDTIKGGGGDDKIDGGA